MTRLNLVRTIPAETDAVDGSTTTGDELRRVNFPRAQRGLELLSEPRWANQVVARLCELLALRPGWDSYNAPAPSRDAAMFTLEVLSRIMKPDTPSPFVVPSSTGGIQIEWHQKDLDFEIHVAGPYDGDFWWSERKGGNESEGSLGADLSPLQDLISKLSPLRGR
jgi:hypothetical protein